MNTKSVCYVGVIQKQLNKVPIFLKEELSSTTNSDIVYQRSSAYNLLYNLVVDNFILDFDIDRIKKHSTKKPYILDSNLNISLTHTKELCASVVSNNVVGVDIEEIERFDAFTQKEKLPFYKAGITSEELCKEWAILESIFKTQNKSVFNVNKVEKAGYSLIIRKLEYKGKRYILAVSSIGEIDLQIKLDSEIIIK